MFLLAATAFLGSRLNELVIFKRSIHEYAYLQYRRFVTLYLFQRLVTNYLRNCVPTMRRSEITKTFLICDTHNYSQ